MSEEIIEKKDFIRSIIKEDVNKTGKKVNTRFPPEPNGYLHIGHAKSICLNFGIANEFDNGICNLRFDDTNPTKEDTEFVNSIIEDVKWLGFDWEDREYYTSTYFDKLYDYAVQLIKKEKAFVCDLTQEEMAEHRGSLTSPGKESPYRNRTVEENLELFEKMKNAEFANGEKTLRAKIDMSDPNVHMRDPVIYRISKVSHHKTDDKWSIYPMYDFAHCLSDSIEGITHSICTLEFEVHRPLYDWLLDTLEVESHPQQIEFARLNLSYTIMSKRKLLKLVSDNLVDGWDDPRMPTIAGMRRRGYPAKSIKNFCEQIGVTKVNGITDIALLEHCLRDELNKNAQRALCVVDPLKVIIDNYPEGKIEKIDAVNNPADPESDTREVTFSKELYIERSDFLEDAPRKFFRLSVGREVRFKYGYLLTCTCIVKDENGEVIEIHCDYDPESRGGKAPDGRKIKGTIHWVSAEDAVPVTLNLYDRLFNCENPDKTEEGKDFISNINPDSLRVIKNALIEPNILNSPIGTVFQFERNAYFCIDKDSTKENPIFNRTVTLRDSWGKKK